MQAAVNLQPILIRLEEKELRCSQIKRFKLIAEDSIYLKHLSEMAGAFYKVTCNYHGCIVGVFIQPFLCYIVLGVVICGFYLHLVRLYSPELLPF